MTGSMEVRAPIKGKDSLKMRVPNPVTIGSLAIGRGQPLALIAGPCVMEPGDMTLQIARRLRTICDDLGIPLIFKASFDKANRTSKSSYRGPGMAAGLKIFEQVKSEIRAPVTTDLHESFQARPIAEVVDLLQIPAFLARQTDLLEAAAATGRPLNVKKGQFMAPWDMTNVVAKVVGESDAGLLLTERGTTFGYGRLVNDFRAIPQMQSTGAPVVFDATHSVQLPSAGPGGTATGGDREMVPYLAKAAVAAGCDALFLEVHPRPEEALSDGPNALRLDDLPALLRTCLRLRAALVEP